MLILQTQLMSGCLELTKWDPSALLLSGNPAGMGKNTLHRLSARPNSYTLGGAKKPKYQNSKSTLHFLVAFYSLKTKNIGV